MEDSVEKDMKIQALHLADLKEEAMADEAEAEETEREIQQAIVDMDSMAAGSKKMLKMKALKLLELRAETKHKEASMLMQQYEDDRKTIDEDDALAALERKEEKRMMDAFLSAQKGAVRACAMDEGKKVALMADGKGKEDATRALEISQLQAEAESAEQEALIEDYSLKEALTALETDGPGKFELMQDYKRQLKKAEDRHKEAHVLMQVECALTQDAPTSATAQALHQQAEARKAELGADGSAEEHDVKLKALEMAALKAELQAARQEAEKEDEELIEEMKDINAMKNGPRKLLAIKVMKIVQMRAENQHQKAKELAAQYEQARKALEAADPNMAAAERAEEEALLNEMSNPLSPKSPKMSLNGTWSKMQERAKKFNAHFKDAQDAARTKVLDDEKKKVNRMADGAEKQVKLEALRLAELKEDSAAKEAEALAEDQALAGMEREAAATAAGPRRMLKTKAIKILHLKAEQNHKEAQLLKQQYELDRSQLVEDEATSSLVLDEEARLVEACSKAEADARASAAAEEEADIDTMHEGKNKEQAQKALQIAHIKAEAEAAEGEALLEEEELVLELKEIENIKDATEKAKRQAHLEAVRERASSKHQEAAYLKDIENSLESEATVHQQATKDIFILKKEKELQAMAPSKDRELKSKALEMAKIKADANEANGLAQAEEDVVAEEREALEAMKPGPRKELATKGLAMLEQKALAKRQEAKRLMALHIEMRQAMEADGTKDLEEKMENALLRDIDTAVTAGGRYDVKWHLECSECDVAGFCKALATKLDIATSAVTRNGTPEASPLGDGVSVISTVILGPSRVHEMMWDMEGEELEGGFVIQVVQVEQDEEGAVEAGL